MVDVVDPVTRSRMMANIKGKNTRPELELRKALHALGLRFRIHGKHLPGKPDIVLPRWKAAVFVHGCFWHRHEGCRFASSPATRSDFWNEKFAANVARDRRNQKQLLDIGWKVKVVWECDLKSKGANAIALEVRQWLRDAMPDEVSNREGNEQAD